MADSDFNMQDVESGNIQSVGFNEQAKEGKVVFNKGAEYIYSSCTQDEADEIANAPSANDAFNAVWKGKKPYRRVG